MFSLLQERSLRVYSKDRDPKVCKALNKAMDNYRRKQWGQKVRLAVWQHGSMIAWNEAIMIGGHNRDRGCSPEPWQHCVCSVWQNCVCSVWPWHPDSVETELAVWTDDIMAPWPHTVVQ